MEHTEHLAIDRGRERSINTVGEDNIIRALGSDASNLSGPHYLTDW